MLKEKAKIMDGEKLQRTTVRIAHEIAEHNADLKSVVLVGIKTRGVPFAKRIGENLKKFYAVEVDTAELADLLRKESVNKKVTFSGGEPLMQKDALIELCGLLPDFDIAV